jgi:BirA family transcriptional regulator, biotin operon repressor / biotin---[acetyl-CoA-carboxylase] ligase
MPVYSITHIPEVRSTNEYAMLHLDSFPDRHIIAAEIQTNGQGRLDRKWISDIPDNIYISIILKPENASISNFPSVNISQFMSLCICDLLDNYGINASLKWPNDILVDGKKIAGLLGQTSILGDRLRGLILGTGINLNMNKKDIARIDQPATALNLLTGFPVDRDIFLDQLAHQFFSRYDAFLEEGFPMIIKEFRQRSPFLGSKIKVSLLEIEISGTAKDFTENGCLVLKTAEGEEQIVRAGDILLT